MNGAELVELMRAKPEVAEPLLLRLLADPQADQLLAELVATCEGAEAALAAMSRYSDATRQAFGRLIARRKGVTESSDLAPEVADRARREMQRVLASPEVMAQVEQIHDAGFIVVLTNRRALEAADQPAPPHDGAVGIEGVSQDDEKRMKFLLDLASEPMRRAFAAPHDVDRIRMVFLHGDAIYHQVLRRAKPETS